MSSSSAAQMSGLVPAYFLILPPGLGLINFTYNPDKLTYTKATRYHRPTQSASSTPPAQHAGSTPQTMTVSVVFDLFTVPPTPPALYVPMLEQCLIPNPVFTAANDPKPPSVLFGWGANIIMTEAIVTRIAVTHQRFLLGMPVRTQADVTLQDLPNFLSGTNPTSGALASRRTHTVVEGDTLASVAFTEYRDPNKWRALAEANNIDDPMRLKPGTELLVPDPREADNLA